MPTLPRNFSEMSKTAKLDNHNGICMFHYSTLEHDHTNKIKTMGDVLQQNVTRKIYCARLCKWRTIDSVQGVSSWISPVVNRLFPCQTRFLERKAVLSCGTESCVARNISPRYVIRYTCSFDNAESSCFSRKSSLKKKRHHLDFFFIQHFSPVTQTRRQRVGAGNIVHRSETQPTAGGIANDHRCIVTNIL